MNFCLALHAKSPKSFDFVLGNLGMVSPRTVRCVNAKCGKPPIIKHTNDDLVAIVVKQIENIHAKSGDSTITVTFSVRDDATVVIKTWWIFHSEKIVVVGVFPNHWLAIGSENKDNTKAFYEL